MAAGCSEFSLVLFVIFTCLQNHITTAETVFYYNEHIENPSLLEIVHRQKRQASNLTTISTTASTTRATTTFTSAAPTTFKATPSPTTRATTTTKAPTTTHWIRLPPDVTIPPGATYYDDRHDYYSSKTLVDSNWNDFWVDLLSHPNKVKHQTLSDAHRVAVRHTLQFNFPFYGHDIRRITIATGGFVYLSDFVHQWLTATQYVAPLMANIDTNLGKEESNLYYLSEANRFIIQWQQVHIKEHFDAGPFTFQLHLLDDGHIYFIYKQMSLPVANISTESHPVKIGTSDAYYYDRTVGNIRKRTIYEYHRIDIDKSKIRTGTVVIISPMKTCNTYGDCQSCTQAKTGFTCRWCSKIRKCSDGMDRHRQSWIDSGCEKENGPVCPPEDSNPSRLTKVDNSEAGKVVGIVLGIFLALLIIGVIAAVLWYGYKNPTTKIGQWLIKNRPSNWKVSFFKRDSAGGDKYRVDSNRESVA